MKRKLLTTGLASLVLAISTSCPTLEVPKLPHYTVLGETTSKSHHINYFECEGRYFAERFDLDGKYQDTIEITSFAVRRALKKRN